MGRIAVIVAALLLMTSPAFAQCAISVPFGNFYGTVAECDDSGPLVGTIQAIDGFGNIVSTRDNSFICLSQDQERCVVTLSGTVGDGLIAFQGDWANTNVDGCPIAGGGTDGGRNFFNVTDASGNRILFSVGRDLASSAYATDNAWPSDSSGQFIANLSCESPREGVTLVSATTDGDHATVQLICHDPLIQSDCDPSSRGVMLNSGSCLESDPAFLASLTALNLYSADADCDLPPVVVPPLMLVLEPLSLEPVADNPVSCVV